MLNDEQRDLAARYMPLAIILAHRYRVRTYLTDRSELRSAAFEGLVDAARTFDPARGVDFSTFARRRIKGALYDCNRFLRSNGWRNTAESCPDFETINPYRQSSLVDDHSKPIGADLESLEDVESWLKRLPKMHATACRLIYIGGKSQDEAAALMGLSKSYLSRVHRQALEWLLDELNKARAG